MAAEADSELVNRSIERKDTKNSQLKGPTIPQFLIATLAIALLAIVILFVQSAYIAVDLSNRNLPLNRLSKTDSGTTLAVIRASQGVLYICMTYVLNEAFMLLLWLQMNSPKGLSYLSLLALSPSTMQWGTFRLLVSSVSSVQDRIWAWSRLFLHLAQWLSGLVLFFNTSSLTVYDAATTYNVTAGIGAFNGSLVQPFFANLKTLVPGNPFTLLPFQYFAAVYILVINPLISTISTPVQCSGESCVSYLLSGGLSQSEPWDSATLAGYQNYQMARVDNTPSVQIDFSSPVSDVFTDADCDQFGSSDSPIAMRFCVVNDEAVTNALRAGLFVCANGTNNGQCDIGIPWNNITTRIEFYTREATVIASRSNYTIVSVESITSPEMVTDIDLTAYREVLRWLLNYTASDIPAPSSIAQSFFNSYAQLDSPYTYGIAQQNFQSIVAFPFWLFNDNNWGNIAVKSDVLEASLPPQFYTTVSIVEPYVKLKFDNAMFVLCVVLQGLVLVFVWTVLIWTCLRRSSLTFPVSAFPFFDARRKVLVDGEEGISGRLAARAQTSEIIRTMKTARVRIKED